MGICMKKILCGLCAAMHVVSGFCSDDAIAEPCIKKLAVWNYQLYQFELFSFDKPDQEQRYVALNSLKRVAKNGLTGDLKDSILRLKDDASFGDMRRCYNGVTVKDLREYILEKSTYEIVAWHSALVFMNNISRDLLTESYNVFQASYIAGKLSCLPMALVANGLLGRIYCNMCLISDGDVDSRHDYLDAIDLLSNNCWESWVRDVLERASAFIKSFDKPTYMNRSFRDGLYASFNA